MFERMVVGLEAQPAVSQAPAIESVAVVGAGPVGQIVACAALVAGCDVALHSPFGREARRLTDSEALAVGGAAMTGSYRLSQPGTPGQAIRITPDLESAVREADAVVLAVPAFTHATYAGLLAPLVRPGQLIVLAPGRCFGAIEFARVLRRQRARAELTIVELETTPYVVTQAHPGRLEVVAEHRAVPAAAFPNTATASAVKALLPALPMLREASGVLETTFANMAGLLVAAPALLAAAAPGSASLHERLPATVVDTVIARLDDERRRVASAFGVRGLPPLAEWLEAMFGTTAQDTVMALDEVTAYRSVSCPAADSTAVHDAVATGLVPMASAGAVADIPTPATATLVGLASALSGLDHVRHGRTMATVGLDGMRTDQIRRALDGPDGTFAREVVA